MSLSPPVFSFLSLSNDLKSYFIQIFVVFPNVLLSLPVLRSHQAGQYVTQSHCFSRFPLVETFSDFVFSEELGRYLVECPAIGICLMLSSG